MAAGQVKQFAGQIKNASRGEGQVGPSLGVLVEPQRAAATRAAIRV